MRTPAIRDGFALIGVAAAAVALVLLADFSRTVPLDRSAAGFGGLAPWLSARDVEARTFYGRAVLSPSEIGLRVLPLHDVDLRRAAPPGESERDRILAQTERDIRRSVVLDKMAMLPTLVVLPKWRAGVRILGQTHPELLVDADAAAALAQALIPDANAQIVRGQPDAALTHAGDAIRVRAPQAFRSEACEPILGDADAMLLGFCTASETGFWLLSDPDLMNNHGLAQGDNAAFAARWLAQTAAEGAVVVDVTTAVWTYSREPEAREWSDLLRFFAYPFSLIWLSFLMLAALTLWRAWRRFGRAEAGAEDEAGPGAERDAAIDMKARLLRLTGKDGALGRAFVEARLDALAVEIVGPHGAERVERMLAAASRKSPALTEDLKAFRGERAFSDAASPEALMLRLRRFDDLIERIRHDFGRAGRDH